MAQNTQKVTPFLPTNMSNLYSDSDFFLYWYFGTNLGYIEKYKNFPHKDIQLRH